MLHAVVQELHRPPRTITTSTAVAVAGIFALLALVVGVAIGRAVVPPSTTGLDSCWSALADADQLIYSPQRDPAVVANYTLRDAPACRNGG